MAALMLKPVVDLTLQNGFSQVYRGSEAMHGWSFGKYLSPNGPLQENLASILAIVVHVQYCGVEIVAGAAFGSFACFAIYKLSCEVGDYLDKNSAELNFYQVNNILIWDNIMSASEINREG